MSRLTELDYFMQLAELASKRSTCLRRQVGAIAVKDQNIIATGYNGAPRKTVHCTTESCLRLNVPSGTRHELCKAAHAEMNVIAQAARHGISLKDSVLYCTHQPCSICLKLIINAGIKVVYYKEGYPDEISQQLVDESGITVMYFKDQETQQVVNSGRDCKQFNTTINLGR